MRTLYLKDPNPFYAPAGDECWVILAKEIMSSYALSYSNQVITSAFSQVEYEKLDKQRCVPQRRSILKRVKYGPLRSVVDMPAVYSAFEKQRKENLRSWGVRWKDTYSEDLDSL